MKISSLCKWIITAVSIICMAVSLSGCESPLSGGSASHRVNIAIQPSGAFVPIFIAKEEGWIEKDLSTLGVTVAWDTFESGPPMNESLLASDSDIGFIGDVPTVTVCAPGNGVEVVAIAAQAAGSYAILTPSDSDIKSAADLKGKRVATVFGSTSHNMIEKYLSTAGLTINDIELVNISAGDAASVIDSKRADALAIWEPNVTRLVEDSGAVIIGEGPDCGLAGTNAIVSRTKYAEGNKEVISVILSAYKRAADALAEGSVSDETLDAVSGYLGITREQLDEIIPKFVYSVEITQEDIMALNDTIDFLNRNGIMRSNYDISQSADGSYYKGER